MSSTLDKLNLRPQERRLLVIVGVVIFIALNYFLVFPYFGEIGKEQGELDSARKKLDRYQTKIAEIPRLEQRLRELAGEGATVAAQEQAVDLLRTVQDHVRRSGVSVSNWGAVTSNTQSNNEFFEEQSLRIQVSTGEAELVNFLFNVGTGNSMIRVRELTLRPENPRYRLTGTITLVANYQKKSPASAPAGPARPVAAASRP
jgi:Tfp pilus assembly protein PilO